MSAKFATWPVLFVVMGCVVVTASQPGLSQINRRHTETRLAAFPAAAWETAVLSPDGARVAYVMEGVAGARVVVNDAPGLTYDRVAVLEFSPDGRRLAYAAERAGAWYVVVDEEEQGPYARVGAPVFSPNSERLAYVAMVEGGARTVVVDGRQGAAYEGIFDGRIVWSGDGRHVVYGSLRGDAWYVVLDGQERGPYDYLGSATEFVFSPNGDWVVASVLEGGAWSLIVLPTGGAADDRQAPKTEAATYENLGQATFAPGGRELAYVAQAAGRWFVVRGGTREATFDAIGEDSLRYAPDGQRLAYAGRRDGAWHAVLDGRAAEPASGVADMVFSPDGRSFAYVHESDKGQWVVLDGRPQSTYDAIGGGTLVFSPNGRRLGYVARTGRARFVVLNGVRQRRFENVGYLTFSPDSRAAAYVAVDIERAFTVVNGREAAHTYDEIWLPPERRLLFVHRDTFRYLGVRDGALYLVEERVD